MVIFSSNKKFFLQIIFIKKTQIIKIILNDETLIKDNIAFIMDIILDSIKNILEDIDILVDISCDEKYFPYSMTQKRLKKQ